MDRVDPTLASLILFKKTSSIVFTYNKTYLDVLSTMISLI